MMTSCYMQRPPPSSTLFPYTTLFRSRDFGATPEPSGGKPKKAKLPVFVIQKHHATAMHYEDRKSTRLNSSHSSTSYAVFCLKKKTFSCVDALTSTPVTFRTSGGLREL